MEALAGRYEATTLDSFAWRLIQRWHRLVLHIGQVIPPEQAYDETCALAAALLQREHVRDWVACSFPLVLVDEAQDLSAERSAIVEALAYAGTVLVAYDEFQCLNPELLPISIEGWLRNHCEPITLEGCRRTNVDELIAAARAVRNGEVLNRDGRRFRVVAAPGQALAATYLANAIAWRNGGNVAVLTPSRQGGFADNAVARVCAGPVGQRQNGPFDIEWERSEERDAAALWATLHIGERCTVDEAVEAMAAHRNEPEIRTVRNWILRQRSTRGLREVSGAELHRQLDRAFSLRRRFGQQRQPHFAAMTVQQAKNREFEHVVVLWPYTVPNNDEQRRRLLYNAITRAKRSCTVVAQNQAMLDEPPFSPRAAAA
ncbi:MAG: ATP-binding domain-containing protein [Rhodospirillaceae bacterium]